MIRGISASSASRRRPVAGFRWTGSPKRRSCAKRAAATRSASCVITITVRTAASCNDGTETATPTGGKNAAEKHAGSLRRSRPADLSGSVTAREVQPMFYRSLILAGAVALASLGGLGRAMAESRIALVIGNSAYQSVPQLPNPANDAKQMTEFLKSAHFEVMTARNLTQTEMRRTIGEFARKVASKGPDTVALVYYGGHGLQVDGDNYLVPVDANIKQEADVPLQTLRLADLMNALAAVPSKTRIVMLDACRNNPFSELNKTGGRGLAIVDAPNGSIVSYATAPGSEAEDGEGRNSPYTSAFLTAAREPGIPIEQALKRVRYTVHQATDGRQTPWESSSLTGDFSFFQGKAETTGSASAGQLASSGSPPFGRTAEGWQDELRMKSPREAYEVVIREDSLEAYEAFLEIYPSESFAPRVRSLLDRRQELVAWHEAVTINSPAAYREFLASYPSSDYASTAQRLVSRTDSRSLSADARACKPTRMRRTDVAKPERRASLDNEVTPRSVVATPPFEVPSVVSHPPIFGLPFFGRRHGKPDMEKPHMGKPGIDKPGIDKPIIGKPVIDKPIIDKPILGKPVIDKPHVVKPIIDKSPVVKPVIDKRVSDKRVSLDKPKIINKPHVVGKTPTMIKSQTMSQTKLSGPKMTGGPMRTMSMRPAMGGGSGMRFGGGMQFGRR